MTFLIFLLTCVRSKSLCESLSWNLFVRLDDCAYACESAMNYVQFTEDLMEGCESNALRKQDSSLFPAHSLSAGGLCRPQRVSYAIPKKSKGFQCVQYTNIHLIFTDLH